LKYLTPQKRRGPLKATKILTKEHDLILEALDTFTSARKRLEKGEFPDVSFFEKAVEFSKTFSDQGHHFKEEYLLFGLLAQKENGALDLEMGALRYQHERNRFFLNNIEESIKAYGPDNEIVATTLLENLASYISILRRHIHKEDHYLFMLADQALSDEEHKSLLKQFEIEDQKGGWQKFYQHHKQLVVEMNSIMQ